MKNIYQYPEPIHSRGANVSVRGQQVGQHINYYPHSNSHHLVTVSSPIHQNLIRSPPTTNQIHQYDPQNKFYHNTPINPPISPVSVSQIPNNYPNNHQYFHSNFTNSNNKRNKTS